MYLLDRDNLGGGPAPITCPGTVTPPTKPPECAAFPMLPRVFFCGSSPGPAKFSVFSPNLLQRESFRHSLV